MLNPDFAERKPNCLEVRNIEHLAYLVAMAGNLRDRNQAATVGMDALMVPRKDRSAIRESLLVRAQEIASFRAERVDGKPRQQNQNLKLRLRDGVLLDLACKEITARAISAVTMAALPDEVYDYDPGNRVWLVGCRVWDEYRRGDFHLYESRWLFGKDDSGYWAVRVPRTCYTVQGAMVWLRPAAVDRAEAEGRWVARQGDVYFVELHTSTVNLDELPPSHDYNAETRTFSHDRHSPVTVPNDVKGVRVYRQSQIDREGGRRYAD